MDAMGSGLEGAAILRSTVGRQSGIGYYPPKDGLALAAKRLGTTRGTVKQMVWGPSNAFQRVRVILQSLVESGQGALAAGLKSPLDAAVLPPATRDLSDLLHEEQELDGAEDMAQLALAQDLDSPAARDTYRKRLCKLRATIDELLLALTPE